MYFVYIIYSSIGDCYYKGFSVNPKKRLISHKKGESSYTSKFSDWKLVYCEYYSDKSAALKREKSLKKYSKVQLLELIKSSRNKLFEL